MTEVSFNSDNTKIFYGIENCIFYRVKHIQNAKEKLDLCGDNNFPYIITKFDFYKDNYIKARYNGVKIRYITEITRENIHYCKELKQYVDELRHLEGLKGAIALSESEFVGAPTLNEKQHVTQLIYSKEKEIVEQQQYIFDTLWKNSIQADIKIKEIEEFIEPTRTEIVDNQLVISERILELAEKSNEMFISCTIGGMHLIYNYFFNVYKEVTKKQRRSLHRGIKWIVSINNKDDIKLVKRFIDIGIEIRHLSNVPQPNFALSDKMLNSTIEKMEDGKMVTSLLSSNDPLYLNHYKTIFKEGWNNGIDAKDRIKEIENGLYTNTKIINDYDECIKLISELMKFVKNEILIFVPSENGILRIESERFFRVLDELASRGIKVKVLYTKVNELNDNNDIIEKIKISYQNIEFKSMQAAFQPLIRITVFDREKTILMEIKDDRSNNSVNSVGASLYIESKSTALSYALIFENLWNQSEMYEKLHDAYERLKLNEKMQKEFIDIVAHELRTPITPIRGLTEIVRNELKDARQKELLDIVIDSSNKLQTLTEKILNITRIEGKLFKISKERFNLNQLVYDIVGNFQNSLRGNVKEKIKFVIDTKDKEGNIWINADKIKIAEVISNLIENSIEFILGKEEIIQITIYRKRYNNDKNNDNANKSVVIVSIRDNGKGIDTDIVPRLFTKFASRSFQGTGLGLYLSKNIIEIHGGKIWCSNNNDGNGATFSFSIPMDNQQ